MKRSSSAGLFCATFVLAAIGAASGCAQGTKVGDTPSDEGSSGAGGGAGGAGGAGQGLGGGAPSGASSSSSGSGASSSSGSVSSSSGAGGASSGSSSSSSSSSSGAGGGGGGGVVGPGSTIFAAYGGSTVFGSTDKLQSMTVFSNPFNEMSSTPIGLAVTGAGKAALLIRSEPSGELRYAFWQGNWSPSFGAAMPTIAPGITILGGPSVAASASDVHVVYQSVDTKFYYAKNTGGAWLVVKEALSVGNVASTGPMPPALAMAGGNPVAVWVGADGDLHDQVRANAVWSAPGSHGLSNQVASVTPAVTALLAGPELVVVFNATAGDGLSFMTRAGGVWSAPAPIAGASSKDRPSLAPLAAGGAVLAYEGVDGHAYTATLSAGMNPSWSAPVVGVGGQDPVLVVPPAVATGATGADAELVYLDDAYVVHASRLVAGAWTAPNFMGSAGGRLALATGD